MGISIPNTFSPNTTILSAQVNANFSTLGTNALNLTGDTMTGTLTAQAIAAALDATYDLGTNTTHFRNLYLSGAVTTSTVTSTTVTTTTLSVTGTTTTQVVVPSADATYDLGSSGARYVNAHLSGTLTANAIAAVANNTADIGASGTRFRDIYVARNVVGPAEFAAGNSGAAITLDFTANGPVQTVTRTASCTYTLTAPPAAGYVTLRMVHDATANSYTVTFSPVPKYPGGTAPTYTNTTSAIDILSFYYDGATWYAVGQVSFS